MTTFTKTDCTLNPHAIGKIVTDYGWSRLITWITYESSDVEGLIEPDRWDNEIGDDEKREWLIETNMINEWYNRHTYAIPFPYVFPKKVFIGFNGSMVDMISYDR